MDIEGLRERKKLATRESICEAAMRLALERGLERVRVHDIAAEAGVSPRTYNNYFSSKEQAVCALMVDRAPRLGEALRDRPPEEPLADAISSSIISVNPGPRREMIHLIMSTPALHSEFLKVMALRESTFAEAIADRVDAPPAELFPQLMAAAYSTAGRVVMQKWLAADGDADYASMLREALELLAPMARAYEQAHVRR
jgi:AcrR family transcriptional regulator